MTKNRFAKSLADYKYRQRVKPNKKKRQSYDKYEVDDELKRWWEQREQREDNDNR